MRYFILVILLFRVFIADAQTLTGVVIDVETGKPLFPVTVVNLNSKATVYTDDKGQYAINAKTGDVVSFSYIGYNATQYITPPSVSVSTLRVRMVPINVQLNEFTLKRGYTPYQKDSAERAQTYQKELVQPNRNVTVGFNNGVAINGPISFLASKLGAGDKEKKKFRKDYKMWEQNRFIDTRYTPELVTSLTGFSGDTLATFMNSYPMEYDFARAASDLEIKMWIRHNYKEYLNKIKQPTEPIVKTTN
ncbi:MAG TPA: carboxypeptidase-like regulatory domain-containing protein [Flavipsychrobacter sp.]|nr:carboxypeptidase-like regulatory domain-containing protein [Flavipsychrobacter sp.]